MQQITINGNGWRVEISEAWIACFVEGETTTIEFDSPTFQELMNKIGYHLIGMKIVNEIE